ncbi:ABC transporter substrate-binding protein [Arthrobacter citreus]|uniref:ABC transporter substrate-binding protein n=1 Tax=Arthrobacter TaxID=1663 RepID=UPI00126402E1|nr:ABC transporter substrate-binding protein [Arthrobacter gandavensis]
MKLNRKHPASARALPLLVLSVLTAVLASGCSQPGNATESTDKRGGEVVYLDAELSSNTQLQSSGTWQDSAYIQNITDRLIYRDPETLELKPWIAEEWTVSDDGLTYTFVIRDGVTFSNGQVLDAQAVKRNLDWQAAGDSEKGIPANNWFPKVSAVTADDASRTVTVQLTAPHAPFLNVLSFWRTSLVADETINAPIEAQSQLTGIIGSGPFTVESEKYGEEIVLARRDGYAWAPPDLENQGEAYLDRITIIPVTEDSVRLGSLRAGEADLIRYIQPSEEKTLTAAGLEVVSVQGVGNSNVWDLRQSAPFLEDVRVRQALQHGIDRDQIISDLYTENWNKATSILTPGSLGYKDESEKLAFDPDKSNQLLDDAGWTGRDADGFRTRNGEQLHILTYVDVYDSTSKPLFQLIQWQLKQLGVNLEIKETDYANYSTVLADPSVGARRNGWPEADPIRLTVNYSSEYLNAFNLQQPDAELDALLAEQLTATDADVRSGIIGKIQDHVIDSAYALPILDDSQVFALQPTLHGLSFGAEARPSFYETWTETK